MNDEKRRERGAGEPQRDERHGERQWEQTQAHPSDWQEDLNPDPLGGQNIGDREVEHEPAVDPAAEDKEVVELLSDFTMDELREFPVLTEGAQLEQGATYVDLHDSERRPFRATGEMVATAENRYVPKSETPYPIWNRIVGAEPPERRE